MSELEDDKAVGTVGKLLSAWWMGCALFSFALLPNKNTFVYANSSFMLLLSTLFGYTSFTGRIGRLSK